VVDFLARDLKETTSGGLLVPAHRQNTGTVCGHFATGLVPQTVALAGSPTELRLGAQAGPKAGVAKSGYSRFSQACNGASGLCSQAWGSGSVWSSLS
jgi:hypothetical protein